MAKKKEQVTTLALHEDLTASIISNINQGFKSAGKKVAYRLSDNDAPVIVTEWVPSGCTMLDLAISNRPNGGFPVGRITEIAGMEAAGKSLLAAHALANTQKMGGIAVYIDTESSISLEFLKAIGVDLANLIYVQSNVLEECFDIIEKIIEESKKIKENKPVITVVLDSIAASTTKNELATNFDKTGFATSKALILSQAFRKITELFSSERVCFIATNQLRTKMNVTFGDPYTTPGGYALQYHASVRLRVKGVGKIKHKVDGRDEIIGVSTQIEVKKNRVGPPFRVAECDILFNSGIDDYGSWFTALKKLGIISSAGAWYKYTDETTGEEIKFQSKDFLRKFIHDEELKERIYHKICDYMIMKYKESDDFISDQLEIDEDYNEIE